MEVDEKFLSELQQEANEQRNKNVQLSSALAGSSFSNQQDNLIQYQLDAAELLNTIEHYLKGEYLSIDNEGNEFWVIPKEDGLIPLNQYGVSVHMVTFAKYINKNTFLSFYSEDRIYEKIYDLGMELTKVVFCNYEKMGMTTESKKTTYMLNIITMLDIIESSYRRAMSGNTMERINTATIVTQSDLVGNRMPMMNKMSMKKKFNLFKPGTW